MIDWHFFWVLKQVCLHIISSFLIMKHCRSKRLERGRVPYYQFLYIEWMEFIEGHIKVLKGKGRTASGCHTCGSFHVWLIVKQLGRKYHTIDTSFLRIFFLTLTKNICLWFRFVSNASLYRVIFLNGPALKVLSVGDGKVPTKKVKVLVKFSHFLCDISLLSLFW